jgi:hypothetical protein
MKPMNLTGCTFGRLDVLRKLDRAELQPPLCDEPNSFWSCACECGASCVVRGSNLARGITKSCGCIKRECLRLMNSRRWRQPSIGPSLAGSRRERPPAEAAGEGRALAVG